MSIEVSNVSKIYGKQRALDNVSFKINAGEVVGFLGPNGAGKTTMMRIITCFIPQTEGKVLVNNFDVITESLLVRKNIGYLPEHNPLYLEMYVKEYLSFVAGIYKLKNPKSRIFEIIEQTGLLSESHKKIGDLSKGYRQRVGLAQALLHNPDVLILDEPTTGLDPNQIIEIRNLIVEVGKKKTIMLSTHIMQEVEAICNRVIIIDKGKIVADNSVSKIRNIEDFQTIILELDREISVEKLMEIEFVTDVKHLNENRFLIQSESKNDIRSKIFQFAVENHFTVLGMQKYEKTIEEVFRELTK